MIEGGKGIHKFEEICICTKRISVLGICDFQGRLKDGSQKGDG